MTLAGFEELVSIVSSLAMKGCLFLGEFPAWLADIEAGSKVSLLQFFSFYLCYFSILMLLRKGLSV